MDTFTDTVTEYFDTLIDSAVHYAESHDDAGSNYAHMPAESWIHNNELQTFVNDNDIDTKGLDIDQVAELYLEGFEMVSEHMYATTHDYVFQPFAYAVGEVEEQIELSVVTDKLEINTDQLIAIMLAQGIISKKPERDTVEVYGNSDMFWCAQMTASALQDAINDETDS